MRDIFGRLRISVLLAAGFSFCFLSLRADEPSGKNTTLPVINQKNIGESVVKQAYSFGSFMHNIGIYAQNSANAAYAEIVQCAPAALNISQSFFNTGIPTALASYNILTNRQEANNRRFLLIPAFIAGYMLDKLYKRILESMTAYLHNQDKLTEDQFTQASFVRSAKVGALMSTSRILQNIGEYFGADEHFRGDLAEQFDAPQKFEILITALSRWGLLLWKQLACGTAIEHIKNADPMQLVSSVVEKVGSVLEGGLMGYEAYKTSGLITSRVSDRLQQETIKKFVLFFIPALYWQVLKNYWWNFQSAVESAEKSELFLAGLFTEISLVGIIPYLYRQAYARVG